MSEMVKKDVLYEVYSVISFIKAISLTMLLLLTVLVAITSTTGVIDYIISVLYFLAIVITFELVVAGKYIRKQLRGDKNE
ncbi:hypothetical protein TEU_03360 [Thermococcus eurythermalis]|uniref:Uncharacterized protein n=1 Tax=Thermococcus eurythermalis TaxID=1505907 RepID=A0A097QSI6_9EURY|nr:hypothetical protein [Thermococcus eurythermalis]AIU69460.1 hypothetical protein TEU_03360 [Thermococcus eurythermalis]